MDHFLSFYPSPLNNPINQNFKKKKEKTPGDIIILHKCTKNHDYMVYCSWDMAWDECNCFQFGKFFHFYPSNSPKNENFKKMKKTPGNIIILHNCTKNNDYKLHCSWDMVHDWCNCYFSFWAIFCLFTTITAQKIKISKKKSSGVTILHMCTKNYN